MDLLIREAGGEFSRLSAIQFAFVAGSVLVCGVALLWYFVASELGKRLYTGTQKANSCTDEWDVDVDGILQRRRRLHSQVASQRQTQAEDIIDDEIRHRMLLRRVEQEINGAILETASKNLDSVPDRVVTFSPDQIAQLRDRPADCYQEFAELMKCGADGKNKDELSNGEDEERLKQTLRVLHDVLAFNLSSNFRDMNKVSVFCNALLQHDALHRLRQLQLAKDPEIARFATLIIEKAVPSIWHC